MMEFWLDAVMDSKAYEMVKMKGCCLGSMLVMKLGMTKAYKMVEMLEHCLV